MGETKGEARSFRVNRYVLMAVGVIIALILLALIYVIPGYGKVFSAYMEQSKAYHAANSDLKEAQDQNAELVSRIEELEQIKGDADAVRDEVFTKAAKLEQDIINGNSDKKICYITIDDGPYKRGNDFIELFNKYDIKATFFLSTANGDKLPDQGDLTARSMYPEYLKYGHTIGNHSYSHNYNTGGIYKNTKSFISDIEKQQEFTAEATGGYKPQIIRFPGGTGMAGSNLESIQEALREKGYGWIDWTIDSGDSWGSDKATVKTIKKNVIDASKKQKIMVILFHEWSANTVKALPDIIDKLTEEGFIFLPLFYDSAMVNK